jgi:hypothetical protein
VSGLETDGGDRARAAAAVAAARHAVSELREVASARGEVLGGEFGPGMEKLLPEGNRGRFRLDPIGQQSSAGPGRQQLDRADRRRGVDLQRLLHCLPCPCVDHRGGVGQLGPGGGEQGDQQCADREGDGAETLCDLGPRLGLGRTADVPGRVTAAG